MAYVRAIQKLINMPLKAIKIIIIIKNKLMSAHCAYTRVNLTYIQISMVVGEMKVLLNGKWEGTKTIKTRGSSSSQFYWILFYNYSDHQIYLLFYFSPVLKLLLHGLYNIYQNDMLLSFVCNFHLRYITYILSFVVVGWKVVQ